MNLTQARTRAAELHIVGRSKMSKAELLEAITRAERPSVGRMDPEKRIAVYTRNGHGKMSPKQTRRVGKKLARDLLATVGG